MIKVDFFDKGKEAGYRISGHANFANRGQDIVCAAVSSLHLSLLAVLEADKIPFSYSEGDTKELIVNDSVGNTHLRMFFVGIKCIEKGYICCS